MSSTATPSDADQFERHSNGGIIVHVLALFTSFVGPAIVYAIADNEFTRANARNAIDWHFTVFCIVVVAFVTTVLGGDEVTVAGEPTELSVVPSPLDTVFSLIGGAMMLATFVAVFATFAFAVNATQKAASGSAWSYPGAINITDRIR